MAYYFYLIGAALLGVLAALSSLYSAYQDQSMIIESRILQEQKLRAHVDYCNRTISEGTEQPVLLQLQPSNCSSTLVTVFRYPGDYATNENNHFLRDGIRKSDCLHEVTDHLSANIWIYERNGIIKDYECVYFEKIMEQRAKKDCPSEKNCTTNWKVIQIDYQDDARRFQPCGAQFLQSQLMAPSNFVWYKRSLVLNRTGLLSGRVAPHDYYKIDGQVQQVNHIPYGVRSDIVLEVSSTICKRYNMTLPTTTKIPLNPVFLERGGGVRYFFYRLRKECRGECEGTRTRSIVSEALQQLEKDHPPFSVSIGMAGDHNQFGRRFVQTEYVKEMLSHKIVIVAQRDFHEDMYRLMEAFASGALVFSDPMLAPPKYLVDGEHYVVYSDMDDLRRKIRYYLEECPAERLRIANKGWNLVMQHYRSFHLMEQVILRQNVDI